MPADQTILHPTNFSENSRASPHDRGDRRRFYHVDNCQFQIATGANS
jgi:hypothetical protein